MDAAQQNSLNLQWKPTTLCGTTMAVDTVPPYISWWGNIQGKRSRKRRLWGKTDRGCAGCLCPWGSLHDLTQLVLTGPKRHPVLAKAKSLNHIAGASGKTFLRKGEELHWQRGVKGEKKVWKTAGPGLRGEQRLSWYQSWGFPVVPGRNRLELVDGCTLNISEYGPHDIKGLFQPKWFYDSISPPAYKALFWLKQKESVKINNNILSLKLYTLECIKNG